jgi:hypothetical protein
MEAANQRAFSIVFLTILGCLLFTVPTISYVMQLTSSSIRQTLFWIISLFILSIILISISEAPKGSKYLSITIIVAVIWIASCAYMSLSSNIKRFILWLVPIILVIRIISLPLASNNDPYSLLTRLTTISLILGTSVWLGFANWWPFWYSPSWLMHGLFYIQIRQALFLFALILVLFGSIVYALRTGMKPYSSTIPMPSLYQGGHPSNNLIGAILQPIIWVMHKITQLLIFVLNLLIYVIVTSAMVIISALRYLRLSLLSIFSAQNFTLFTAFIGLTAFSLSTSWYIWTHLPGIWAYITNDVFWPEGAGSIAVLFIIIGVAVPAITLIAELTDGSGGSDSNLPWRCAAASAPNLVVATSGLFLASLIFYTFDFINKMLNINLPIFGFGVFGLYFIIMCLCVVAMTPTYVGRLRPASAPTSPSGTGPNPATDSGPS